MLAAPFDLGAQIGRRTIGDSGGVDLDALDILEGMALAHLIEEVLEAAFIEKEIRRLITLARDFVPVRLALGNGGVNGLGFAAQGLKVLFGFADRRPELGQLGFAGQSGRTFGQQIVERGLANANRGQGPVPCLHQPCRGLDRREGIPDHRAFEKAADGEFLAQAVAVDGCPGGALAGGHGPVQQCFGR